MEKGEQPEAAPRAVRLVRAAASCAAWPARLAAASVAATARRAAAAAFSGDVGHNSLQGFNHLLLSMSLGVDFCPDGRALI